MSRIFAISLFILWSSISYSQTTKDSLAELQSLLDSIPDISLAELGIDTTAEIVLDTLHLVIPASIASDTAYANTCLKQAIELITAGKYDDAYTKADTAKHIYQMNIGYVTKEVADCMHQMGRSLNFSGNAVKALSLIGKTILLRINLFGDFNIDVASSFFALAYTYDELIDNYKAIKCLNKALKVKLLFLNQNHLEIAFALNNLGFSYKKIKEYDKSLSYLFKSLYIKNIINSSQIEILRTYHNIGDVYFERGEEKKASEFYNNALKISLKEFGVNDPYIARLYNIIGYCLNSFGDFKSAKSCHLKALEIRIKSYGEIHHGVADSHLNLGVSFQGISDLENAIINYEKAKIIYTKLYGENSFETAYAINNIATIYFEKGYFEKSIEYHLIALKSRLLSVGENNRLSALSYFNLGMCYYALKNYFESEKHYLKGLEIRKKVLGLNHPDIAISYKYLGDIFKVKGEFDKTIEFYQQALSIRLIKLGFINQASIESNKEIANIYQKLNQLDSSLYYIHQAISGIKAQMSSDISSETKKLYQSQNIPVFESAIEVSLIKSKQDQHDSLKYKTYEYTELAKASLLQSQIKQTDALAFAGIPDSLLQKEYDLRIDINWREKQRQGLLEKGKTETDTTVLRISSIIFDLKREQETLFKTLENDYPEYYRLKYDTKTISLEDTQQKLLQKGQTMLEYFVGDSSIFIFVVRPDTFEVVQVKKDFTLDSLVKQLQSGLYGYHGQTPDKRTDVLYKKTITDYTKAAHELYNRIIAPVAHLLTSDLVIIPDGVLGYVPFEALLKSKPEKLNQFGTYPYLINDHTISYNYSATLWNEMKNKKHKKEPSKSLVAFAPFYEGSYTVLDSSISLVFDTLPDGRDTTIFQDIVTRKTYAPLPSSGIEAGTVSKLYKGDYFVNSHATEQKFYDLAGDYRMVHLSTHGVADARQGDYSYLAFAEQKDSIENEFLYVRDIYNTQLNADLVFLSACETAQGELQRGEGIISLARAFAYAGAKSIITTLWQVEDAATKDISIDFYKKLKKGFTKDVALRQAKLRHIKSAKSAQKHPFFWAAMIGIGDMGVVR
jgi:CHAT domain-containing protein